MEIDGVFERGGCGGVMGVLMLSVVLACLLAVVMVAVGAAESVGRSAAAISADRVSVERIQADKRLDLYAHREEMARIERDTFERRMILVAQLLGDKPKNDWLLGLVLGLAVCPIVWLGLDKVANRYWGQQNVSSTER